MQMRSSTSRYLAGLAMLASIGQVARAETGGDRKDQSKPLPLEIVKAWQDAGAVVGWMKDVPPRRSGSCDFWNPWCEKGDAGAMPAFRLPERDAGGMLAKLPDPGTAFGLDFHCGFYAGVNLKELAELKNLHSLNFGGIQGRHKDLKELAAFKNSGDD